MNRKLISVTAVAAVAAASFAPAAGAADAAPAQQKLDVTGAYLYLDHDAASKRDFVRVVFRTSDDLPRRADRAIQAAISIDGFSHSIGSVTKGAPVYTGAAAVKGGSITALNGKSARKGATVGRSYTVRFFLNDGTHIARKMTLRAERKGDDSGKPLRS